MILTDSFLFSFLGKIKKFEIKARKIKKNSFKLKKLVEKYMASIEKILNEDDDEDDDDDDEEEEQLACAQEILNSEDEDLFVWMLMLTTKLFSQFLVWTCKNNTINHDKRLVVYSCLHVSGVRKFKL